MRNIEINDLANIIDSYTIIQSNVKKSIKDYPSLPIRRDFSINKADVSPIDSTVLILSQNKTSGSIGKQVPKNEHNAEEKSKPEENIFNEVNDSKSNSIIRELGALNRSTVKLRLLPKYSSKSSARTSAMLDSSSKYKSSNNCMFDKSSLPPHYRTSPRSTHDSDGFARFDYSAMCNSSDIRSRSNIESKGAQTIEKASILPYNRDLLDLLLKAELKIQGDCKSQNRNILHVENLKNHIKNQMLFIFDKLEILQEEQHSQTIDFEAIIRMDERV